MDNPDVGAGGDAMDISGILGGSSITTIAQSQKDMLDSQLVTKTLDTLNTKPDGSTNSNYEFQKTVLQGAFMDKGSQVDTST
jgi:hypothetical protein